MILVLFIKLFGFSIILGGDGVVYFVFFFILVLFEEDLSL